MKWTVAVVAVLLLAPLTLATTLIGTDSPEVSVTAPDTPLSLQALVELMPLPMCPIGVKQYEDACLDYCAQRHYLCAIRICGYPCLVEPCISEWDDCAEGCGF